MSSGERTGLAERTLQKELLNFSSTRYDLRPGFFSLRIFAIPDYKLPPFNFNLTDYVFKTDSHEDDTRKKKEE